MQLALFTGRVPSNLREHGNTNTMNKQLHGTQFRSPDGGNLPYFPCFTIKGLHWDLLLGFTRSFVAAGRGGWIVHFEG